MRHKLGPIKVLILSNHEGAEHPLHGGLLQIGETVVLNIIEIKGNRLIYLISNGDLNYINIESVKLVNKQRFIYLDQIKNLPDNCFVRSKEFY